VGAELFHADGQDGRDGRMDRYDEFLILMYC
jgi:hypothetical protein